MLETARSVTLNVSVISGRLERPVQISYFTVDGSATSTGAIDFTSVSPTPLTFDMNRLFNTFTISINNDAILEYPEIFFARLRSLDGSVDVGPDNATVTILEEDGDDGM